MELRNENLGFAKNLEFESFILNPLQEFFLPLFFFFFFFFWKWYNPSLFMMWFFFFLKWKRKEKKRRKKKRKKIFFWELTLQLVEFKWGGQTTFLVSLFFLSFLLSLPPSFLPPLTLFTLIFTLIFLLHLTISSPKKIFSNLLNLPSLISLNISLDPCVLEHFCHTPIFGETH